MSEIKPITELPVGTTVHIHRHLRKLAFERCVVEDDGNGGVQLRSVAVVGDWPRTMLPHRTEHGRIDLGQTLTGARMSAPERVLGGLLVEPLPAARKVVECNPALAARCAPSQLPPLELTVAPMSADERRSTWDKWLASHLITMMYEGQSSERIMDMAEIVSKLRANPWPEGEPTMDEPNYPILTLPADVVS